MVMRWRKQSPHQCMAVGDNLHAPRWTTPRHPDNVVKRSIKDFDGVMHTLGRTRGKNHLRERHPRMSSEISAFYSFFD
jgi:hypothetical protein